MLHHPKQRSRSHRRQRSRHGLILVEPMERRMLLSTGVAPIWATQEAPPVNSPANSTVESATPVSTYDPYNGDLLVAYEAISTTSPSEELPIIVAAYKPDGDGGLKLDTSFGDYNAYLNDGASAIGEGENLQGFSIVNPAALMGWEALDTFMDPPIGIAVDPSGNIDVVWPGDREAGGIGILQLLPNGTPNPSFGNWGNADTNPDQLVAGANGAEAISIYAFAAGGPYPEYPLCEAMTVNQNDIIVAGSSFTDGPIQAGTNIFAFSCNGGAFDPSFGGSGWEAVSNPDNSATGFSAVSSDSSDNIYAACSLANGVGVAKVDPNGTLDTTNFGNSGVKGWSEITSIPGDPGAGFGSPFGIGLTSDGHIIVGGGVNNGYFLSTLDSSGNLVTAYVGQQYVASSVPSQMAVNPDGGDVVVNTLNGGGATGFHGSSSWGMSNPNSNYGMPSFSVFYNGSIVLVGSYTTPNTDPNPGINEITLAVYNDPTVTTFQVNDGSAQRSMVDSLTVTFNEPVTLSAGAITLDQLSQTGGASTPMSFTLTPSSGSSATWVLTFTDPSYIGGSLPDGAYELIVSAGRVTSASSGQTMTGDQDFTLYRLYGDFYGTGSVTGTDFTLLTTLLGGATGSTYWYVDFYNTGFVTGGDYTQFTIRLGTTANIPPLPSVEVLTAAPATTSATTKKLTTKKPSVTKLVSSVAAAPKTVSKPKPKHGHG